MIQEKKVKQLKMNVLMVFVLSSILWSCEGEKSSLDPLTPDPEPIADSSTSKTDTISTLKPEKIGAGSGQIVIKDTENKRYIIKPGKYWNVNIKNVENVIVEGSGAVKIVGGDMQIQNTNKLTISGISFENHNQPVVFVDGRADNLTIKDITLKDITNTVIVFKKDEKYNGKSESFSDGVHLVNIKAENIGTLFGSSGGLNDGSFFGLIKNFKLSGCSIINSPGLSNGIYLGLAENYEISHNYINNVNTQNNKHNGIFHVVGNGKIFGNTILNHQGNAVRAWMTSVSDPNSSVEIYNNKVYNSRRYSAFELQVTPAMKTQSMFRPANAKVYNNTVGRMNTDEPKYFEGRLLDLYNIYGTLEIYNNLLFDMRDEHLINNMSETKIIVNENNRYFADPQEAVHDLIKFKSKVPGIGAE